MRKRLKNFAGQVLCFIGIHNPDVENKVEYTPEVYSQEDRHWKYYKSKCLRCGVSMMGMTPSGY